MGKSKEREKGRGIRRNGKKRETRKERDIKGREKTGGEEGRRKSMDNMEGNEERK